METERLRVLVVDDSSVYRDCIVPSLRTRGGFDVFTAKSAQDAVRMLSPGKFDCLILDVNMPDGASGITLARHCRALDPKVGIVLNTLEPWIYYDDTEVITADACLEKTAFSAMPAVIQNVVWRKRMSPKTRIKQFQALTGDLISCQAAILCKRMSPDESGTEVFGGILTSDREQVAWVVYDSDPAVDERTGAKKSTICISSAVGCGGRCKFCCAKAETFRRVLSPDEMIAQVLYALNGYHAMRVFESPIGLKVNFAYVGDSIYSNLRNACSTVSRLLVLRKYLSGLTFCMTTVGHLDNLKTFLADFSHLPVSICLSLHFPPTVRRRMMPATVSQPIEPILDVLSDLWTKTHRSITVAWALTKGLNDQAEDLKYLAELFAGKPGFEVKLTGMRKGLLDCETVSDSDIKVFGEKLAAEGVRVRVKKISTPWVPNMQKYRLRYGRPIFLPSQ